MVFRQSHIVAVWPCDHGGVHVEPGPAMPGYGCSQCGATASTYVAVDALLSESAAEVADEARKIAPGVTGMRAAIRAAVEAVRDGS